MSGSEPKNQSMWVKIALALAGAGLIVSAALLSCRHWAHPNSGLPTVRMNLGSRSFTLEVANTFESRRRGLMKRDSLPENHGMIFVFAEPQILGFWMKNTRIPLDIVYLDAEGKVVSVHSMQPYDLRSTDSNGLAKYAIELNEGAAAEAGIHPGDRVAIPPAAREPAQVGSGALD